MSAANVPPPLVTQPSGGGAPRYVCGTCGAALSADTTRKHHDWHSSMREVAIALAKLGGLPSADAPR